MKKNILVAGTNTAIVKDFINHSDIYFKCQYIFINYFTILHIFCQQYPLGFDFMHKKIL